MIARIAPRLENLAANPRPPGCKKLKGGDKEWRIRVGDYRVVYTIDDTRLMVEVTRIRHRSEVYERG
jgi:mRNA interferase RelE/StbE